MAGLPHLETFGDSASSIPLSIPNTLPLLNMPPRKKTKGSVRAPSTPAADEDAMAVDTPQADTTGAKSKPAYDILKDPWTDEQETSLFKGIIRWKPAGKPIQSS